MPWLGWPPPPGNLPLLQAPLAVLSALGLYVAENVLERFPAGFALWHTFQRWVRILGLLLLATLATQGLPWPERVALSGVMTLFGFLVYMGASGWEGLLILRRLPQNSQRVTSLAIDIGFAALLVLSLERPLQAAAAMAGLLVIALFQLRLVFRAHMALISAGRYWLRALVFPGKWVPEEALPPEVILAASSDGPVPGKPLRGARATLMDRGVHLGWLVLSSEGAVYVESGRDPVVLKGLPGIPGEGDPLHHRKAVRTARGEGELLVFRDGPRPADLDLVIPQDVS